jgi:large subunit ribosomal protein L21
MYAIVKSGGRQVRVAVGQTVDLDRLPAEAGDTIQLENVLLVGGDDDGVAVGRLTVPGAKVTARVIGPARGEKIIVFKYKAKVRYRRKLGHRQDYTRVRITGIQPGDSQA